MIIINEKYSKWESINKEGANLHYRKKQIFNTKLLKLINDTGSHDALIEELKEELSKNKDYTSGICENEYYIVAWVDHIRSIPVFYTKSDNEFFVSNDAMTIQKEANLDKLDKNAELQFAMSGYVTGSGTLLQELKILQPGEFLVWNKVVGKLDIVRYFKYEPNFSNNDNLEKNKKRINGILDKITKKIIKRADGKTIWVPLSAGLDSRIVLSKLHEHGYENIKTFTYGPKYNFESKYARRIAKTLGVPWMEIVLQDDVINGYFNSDVRKAFWEYADGLKTIPCMREYSAICYLHETGAAKPGDIFVNGQSGDYITGGHIPENWCNNDAKSKDEFFKQIIDKHYDLWFYLKTSHNLERIKQYIVELLPDDWGNNVTGLDLAKYNEMWEYDARQSCYVVNGQRVYEFFGYDWEMPLWEKELVDFCQDLPIEQKIGQSLYKDYLKDYNYKGLFSAKEPYIWRWPANMLWVVALARIIGFVKGSEAKKSFYAYMRHKGHYANQYAFFSKDFHKETYSKCRSIISLYIPIWQSQNCIKAMGLDPSYKVTDLTNISS